MHIPGSHTQAGTEQTDIAIMVKTDASVTMGAVQKDWSTGTRNHGISCANRDLGHMSMVCPQKQAPILQNPRAFIEKFMPKDLAQENACHATPCAVHVQPQESDLYQKPFEICVHPKASGTSGVERL